MRIWRSPSPIARGEPINEAVDLEQVSQSLSNSQNVAIDLMPSVHKGVLVLIPPIKSYPDPLPLAAPQVRKRTSYIFQGKKQQHYDFSGSLRVITYVPRQLETTACEVEKDMPVGLGLR